MAIIDYLKIKVLFLLLICLFFVGGRYKVVFSGTVVATAYNSLVGQTDDSPWTTASGTRCRSGVIASNHLPIGTKVMIEGFGDKIFTVEDRMTTERYINGSISGLKIINRPGNSGSKSQIPRPGQGLISQRRSCLFFPA